MRPPGSQGGEQYILRATIDGQVERVAGPKDARGGEDVKFWFPSLPLD